MIIISERQKAEVRKWLPDEADALLASEDVNVLLDALGEKEVSLFDANDEPTQKAEK